MEKIKKYERALNTGEADPVLLMVFASAIGPFKDGLGDGLGVPLRLLRLYISPPGRHPHIPNIAQKILHQNSWKRLKKYERALNTGEADSVLFMVFASAIGPFKDGLERSITTPKALYLSYR
ncbi:unnamed protein product [Rhizophagus irregularis]|nr:unnamed protein product [Rhizophagus irregularis]